MVGVVILYHPETEALIKNIKTYIHNITTLLVFDNSEIYNKELEISLNNISDKIKFTHFGENQGIAKRLNQAMEYATKSNATYLLMMDQDSSFRLGDFDTYYAAIKSNLIENVAQFGINCQPDFTPISDLPQSVVSLITSGSVLNLKYIQQVGMFNENLFIDFVDTAYSHGINNKGFINLQFTNIILNHSIGNRIEARSLLTFKKSLRIIHSPIRTYYIIRNGLYLLFKSQTNSIQKKDIRRTMMVVKNDFLYHPQRFKVYQFAIKAVWDFLNNRMGKLKK